VSITTGVGARSAPATGIWVLTAGCWSVLIVLSSTGIGHPGHDDVAGGGAGLVDVAGFLAGWLTMVGAMMLPVMAPATRRLPARADGRTPVLVAAFAAVWAASGLLALAGDAVVHRVVDGWAWLEARPGLVVAGVLLLAGVLRLAAPAAAGRGHVAPPAEAGAGAWGTGLRLGTRSLVSDGPLMLVMFTAGSGDLGLMVMLTAVMFAERHERWGGRIAVLIGCALVAAGAVVAVGSR
jgi:predicted metal-binding membrane protein